MRSPLSLVIDDGNGERHVTRHASGMRFKRSAYGGDVDLSCTLTLPRGFFTDLGPNDSVTLYDGRTGGFVFRAAAHQPGVTAGPRGEVFELQAFGGAMRLQAVTDSLAYVHALDDGWKRSSNSTRNAETRNDEKADGTPTLEVYFDKKKDVDASDAGAFVNRDFQNAGLKIARLRADVECGSTSVDYTTRLLTGTDAASLTPADARDANTAAGTLTAYIGSGITLGDDVIEYRANRKPASGTETVADKSRWFRVWNLIARQVLKDKHGDNITTGYTANTVTADEAIRDMVGRGMCPDLDPGKVTIETFDYAIDALSWLDGIKMGDALEELRTLEPKLTWQVYGDEANFGTWPTDPRYVISQRDGGVSHPGEDSASLADRIYVSWTDRRGRQRTTKVTDPSIPVKQEAEPITLPEGVGSEANAQRAGEKALELYNNPPKAGTAVVRRPILDLWTGVVVQPWEIMPGCLVLEQETGDEFRLTEVEYSDDDCAAVLTLGEPVRPLEAVIARLERKQRRRK